jgi:hypothetical protein
VIGLIEVGLNDKNSLNSMENIDEVALCVNGKASKTYAVLGSSYGGRATSWSSMKPITFMVF